MVMVSQRRAVRLTHVDISSASGEKALNIAPGMYQTGNELVKEQKLVKPYKASARGSRF